ncbi:MAG TPA: acyltransferase family protein [Caulobacterales bacterium]|nr:acyltransferase family protein [Caulobacterales bacterium]
MTTPAADNRRLDLDWLRIGAFALLILYHVGMFYVTWDWHIKSSRAGPAIEPLMLLINPWRLTLLFVISGAATRFMADKMNAGRLFASRMGRLFPPLLLAVVLIVPPQSYFEVLDALGPQAAGDPWHFWLKYITASGHWCDADGCLITPTYNHMWFVAYLVVYTLLLFPLLPLLRRAPKALGVLVAGPGLVLTPWLFLWITRVTLFPLFGETHAIHHDWYLHVLYLTAFLFGFAIAKHTPFFDQATRWRWTTLALGLGAYAFMTWARATYDHAGAPPPPAWGPLVAAGVRELQAWCAILAAFGFAYRYLRGADGPARRYLTEAIFPFYLIHQTAIIFAAHTLDPLRLPLWIEAPAVVAFTLFACWAGLELARRVPVLRIWFGLRSQPRNFHGKNPGLAVERTGEPTSAR